MLRKAVRTWGLGLSLNALSVLPAVPAVRAHLWHPMPWLHLPVALECVGALLVIDLSMTLIHIWWHSPGTPARLHTSSPHHTIPEAQIDYAVGQLFGPWEPLIGLPTVWLNIVVWDIPLGVALFATTTVLCFALWTHTNWWPSWYRQLGRIFVTPVSHRLHHSPDPRLYNTNCGFVFNIWDRLLGTYCRP